MQETEEMRNDYKILMEKSMKGRNLLKDLSIHTYNHTSPFTLWEGQSKCLPRCINQRVVQMATGCVIGHNICKTATQVEFTHRSIIRKRI